MKLRPKTGRSFFAEVDRMRKRRFYWELAGFIWTGAAGTALHFFYEWSGYSRWAAVISAVNESTWEHMKLLLVPLFLFSLVQVWFADEPNFLAVRGLSALIGTALIPVLYYTYTGAWGRHETWIDIGIFFVAAAVTFWLDSRWLHQGRFAAGWQQVLGVILLWGLMALFIFFTNRPPHWALFRDPQTGLFGPVI